MPNGGFTVLYDDVLRHPEIESPFEALLVAFVDRYPDGLWLTTNEIAKFLKVDSRTIQRTVKDLFAKGWLETDYTQGSKRRILRANIKPLPPGELFEDLVRKTANKLKMALTPEEKKKFREKLPIAMQQQLKARNGEKVL